jgi:uncharacterized surface protein with fasciclin (FAS1) repeats
MDVSFNDLRTRLDAGDVGWFRDRYHSSELAFLRGLMPAGDYEEMGRRLDQGDLGWVRDRLGAVGFLGGVGGAAGLAVDAPATAPPPPVGALAAIAQPAQAAASGVGPAATATMVGVATATGAIGSTEEDRRRRGLGWLAIIPIVAGLVIAALALRSCGDDELATTGTTAAATATTGEPTTTDAGSGTTAASAGPGSIVEVTEAAGDLSVLASLVERAGLGPTLSGEGPLTVFAPTDDAFANVDKSVLDALGADKEALTRVLSYHVAEGSLTAADLSSGKLPTLAGSNLTIVVDGPRVRVNDASVTTADVEAANGVIHVIDGVLLPPDLDLTKLGVTTSAPATTTTAATATTAAATTTTAAATTTTAATAPATFTVFFDTDAIVIRPSEQPVIDAAVAALRGRPAGTRVAIVGFADPRGDAAINQLLAEGRAQTVRAALAAAVPNAGFTVSAATDPSPSDDMQASRRVEITIG